MFYSKMRTWQIPSLSMAASYWTYQYGVDSTVSVSAGLRNRSRFEGSTDSYQSQWGRTIWGWYSMMQEGESWRRVEGPQWDSTDVGEQMKSWGWVLQNGLQLCSRLCVQTGERLLNSLWAVRPWGAWRDLRRLDGMEIQETTGVIQICGISP